MRWVGTWRFSAVALVATLVVGGAAACGGDDDGSSGDEAAVRAAVDAFTEAQRNGDAEAFLAHVTDNFLKKEVGQTREDVRAAPEAVQEDVQFTVTKVSISGKKASVEGDFTLEGEGAVAWLDRPQPQLVKEGNTWKVDRIKPGSAAKPSGTKAIAFQMNEFAFGFDRRELKSGQPVVFSAENKGKQPHFLDIARIPADADLDELFASDEPPEGVEFLAHSSTFQPGDKADLVLREPLTPGRYIFVCFIGDSADGTPHAFKGMVSDFTVQ